jgi:hypothetical protein
MLISGYVDLSDSSCRAGYHVVSTQLFRRSALRELGEELVVIKDSKQLVPGQISQQNLFVDTMLSDRARWASLDHGVDLFFPHQALRENQGRERFKVIPTKLPSYLGNMLGRNIGETITVNGTELLDVGFQYCRRFNSGQLIFPFQIELPDDGAGLSLFHAEDGPIPESPRSLQTSIDSGGLVLAALSDHGELTGDTYWLRGGELMPRTAFSLAHLKLSEAFDRRRGEDCLPAWAVDGGDVWFQQYTSPLDEG